MNEDLESGSESQTESKATEPKKANHVNEYSTGQKDPFAEAFNKAQDTLSDDADNVKKEKPKPANPEKKADPEKEKKAPLQGGKNEDSKDESNGDVEKPQIKPDSKKSKEPPSWWSSARKEAFKFQPKHIQEQMLKEPPAPDQRWTTEQKEAFAKLPDEGKVIVLERSKEFERGFHEKFESLANERKLAEDVKRSITPAMRDYMSRSGINESQAVQKLFELQHKAMTDPIAYVKEFVSRLKIAPTDIYGLDESGNPIVTQTKQKPQADIRSHPEVSAMAQELQALRAQQAEFQKSQIQQGQAEFTSLLEEKDGEGNSLYPFIRLLADPMAAIIQSNPDLFKGLSLKERLSYAYHQALQDFPELASLQMSTKKAELDEDEAEEVEPDEEEKRIRKLEKAKAPKSKSPQTGAGKRATDPLEAAIQEAQKQLKSKR